MSRGRRAAGPRFFRPPRPAGNKRASAVGQGGGTAASVVARISGLTDEGRGIARIEGDPRPIFVAGALPGEAVALRLREWRRHHGEAELIAVEEPAATRIQPRCPHFGACGGCQLQMLDHATQLAHKQTVVERLLRPFMAFDWEAPLVAEPWHYRHRARLAVASGADGKPLVGFRGALSHRVEPLSDCRVLDPRLLGLLSELPGWLADLRQWQRVSELRIAVDADGVVALAWAAEPALGVADERRLMELAQAAGVRTGPGIELRYRLADAGPDEIAEPLAYRFGLNDFTQINPAVNRQLVRRVIEWLAPRAGDRIVDAFCGLGNFSLPLAQAGAMVIGIEGDAAMVARATANAEQAGLTDRLSFRAANLFAPTALPQTDKLLLDPPRAGARALCETLANMSAGSRPQRVVYVSCDPHTLARDLSLLAAGGYQVERASLVDMFPHTGHIETMALLTANDR